FSAVSTRRKPSGAPRTSRIRSGVVEAANTAPKMIDLRSSMTSRLEQLNRIAVRILNLNLLAARPYLHFISKMQTLLFQLSHAPGQILHLKKDTIPSTGLLLTAIGH